MQGIGTEFAEEFAPKKSAESPSKAKVLKGDSVKVEGYTQVGVVLEEPKDGNVLVQMGILKMTVPISDLHVVATSAKASRPRQNMGLQRAQNASTEVHLRAKRAEDAIEELERFIDDAVLAGLPSVRIVHGKGEGILRNVTREYLRKHPHVSAFRDGEPGEGGHGVTVATFR